MANPNTLPWNVVVETFAELPAVTNALEGYLAFVNASQTGYYLEIDNAGVRTWRPLASGSAGSVKFSGTVSGDAEAPTLAYLGDAPNESSADAVKYTAPFRGLIRVIQVRSLVNTLAVVTTVSVAKNGVLIPTATVDFAGGEVALQTITLASPAVILEDDTLDVEVSIPNGAGDIQLSVVFA